MGGFVLVRPVWRRMLAWLLVQTDVRSRMPRGAVGRSLAWLELSDRRAGRCSNESRDVRVQVAAFALRSKK
jgi:hypothetical protein